MMRHALSSLRVSSSSRRNPFAPKSAKADDVEMPLAHAEPLARKHRVQPAKAVPQRNGEDTNSRLLDTLRAAKMKILKLKKLGNEKSEEFSQKLKDLEQLLIDEKDIRNSVEEELSFKVLQYSKLQTDFSDLKCAHEELRQNFISLRNEHQSSSKCEKNKIDRLTSELSRCQSEVDSLRSLLHTRLHSKNEPKGISICIEPSPTSSAASTTTDPSPNSSSIVRKSPSRRNPPLSPFDELPPPSSSPSQIPLDGSSRSLKQSRQQQQESTADRMQTDSIYVPNSSTPPILSELEQSPRRENQPPPNSRLRKPNGFKALLQNSPKNLRFKDKSEKSGIQQPSSNTRSPQKSVPDDSVVARPAARRPLNSRSFVAATKGLRMPRRPQSNAFQELRVKSERIPRRDSTGAIPSPTRETTIQRPRVVSESFSESTWAETLRKRSQNPPLAMSGTISSESTESPVKVPKQPTTASTHKRSVSMAAPEASKPLSAAAKAVSQHLRTASRNAQSKPAWPGKNSAPFKGNPRIQSALVRPPAAPTASEETSAATPVVAKPVESVRQQRQLANRRKSTEPRSKTPSVRSSVKRPSSESKIPARSSRVVRPSLISRKDRSGSLLAAISSEPLPKTDSSTGTSDLSSSILDDSDRVEIVPSIRRPRARSSLKRPKIRINN